MQQSNQLSALQQDRNTYVQARQLNINALADYQQRIDNIQAELSRISQQEMRDIFGVRAGGLAKQIIQGETAGTEITTFFLIDNIAFRLDEGIIVSGCQVAEDGTLQDKVEIVTGAILYATEAEVKKVHPDFEMPDTSNSIEGEGNTKELH